MLDIIRKHQYGIMLVIAVVVIVAFTFMDGSSSALRARGPQPSTIFGSSYSPENIRKIIQNQFIMAQLGKRDVAMALSSLDPQFPISLSGGRPMTDEREFFVNTVIVRDQADKLGIHVTEKEAAEYIKTLTQFQTNGSFDPGKWEDFKNNNLGKNSRFKLPDVHAAARDVILYEKLYKIVGAANPPSAAEVDLAYATSYQQITASEMVLPLDQFKEGIAPTEEEMKDYYETNSDTEVLKTKDIRGIRVVSFLPPGDDELKDMDEAAKKAALDQYKKTLKELYAKLKGPTEEKEGEESETAQLDFEAVITEFSEKAGSTPPIIETLPFEEGSPPPELAGYQFRELLNAAFDEEKTEPFVSEKPISGFAPNSYSFFEVYAVDPSVVPSYEDALAGIKENLIEKKAREAMDKKAEEIRDAINKAVEEGKAFADVAKEHELSPKELPAFTQRTPPTGDNAQQLRSAGNSVDVNKVSDPLTTSERDGVLLYFVHKKELPLDPKMDEQKKTLADTLKPSFAAANTPFVAWFSSIKEEAMKNMKATATSADG